MEGMDSQLSPLFLDFSKKKLTQCTERIRTCVERLSDDQLWMRQHETENAVGNILLHLAGNVRQWIISGIGGKPDVRVRDREFSARGDIAAQDLLARLEATVEEANAVLDSLTPEVLAERIVIQKHETSKLEAVYHVVEHFGGHTGQIIFVTKLVTGEDLGFYGYLNGPATKKTP